MLEDQKSKELILQVINNSDNEQRLALLEWSQSLLVIRNSPLTKIEKAKKAVFNTQHRKIIFPVLRMLTEQLKVHGWKNRSLRERMAIVGTGIGLSVFSGQSAGLVALGGGIGLPLWIVLGAGGGFAGMIIDEIRSKTSLENEPSSKFKVIDAEEIIERKNSK